MPVITTVDCLKNHAVGVLDLEPQKLIRHIAPVLLVYEATKTIAK
jgi:hypothetical protein